VTLSLAQKFQRRGTGAILRINLVLHLSRGVFG